MHTKCWKELGTGDSLVFAWGAACLKSCYFLREIESAIALWFVGVGMCTALKTMLKGRSKDITLWDLEVCLLRISAWLSLWNNTFLFINLEPKTKWHITNTTLINFKVVMSKMMFAYPNLQAKENNITRLDTMSHNQDPEPLHYMYSDLGDYVRPLREKYTLPLNVCKF